MSNYKTIARRKGQKDWEEVNMLDNYFGRHQYGVEFKNGEILVEREVEFKQV
jgi:hypothetical protein